MDKILQVIYIIFVDLEPYKQHRFVNCMHAHALVIVKLAHPSSGHNASTLTLYSLIMYLRECTHTATHSADKYTIIT